jgi:hypothetical protein
LGNESKTGLSELAHVMVLLLAEGVDRPASPDEISLWLGSTPKTDQGLHRAGDQQGWVQRKEQRIMVLKAGWQMLTRPP